MSGKLIVIEGIDGSGKTTQAMRLVAELSKKQMAAYHKFPNYESPSSMPVRMYLGGEIGDLWSVNSYAASSFYATDRYITYQTTWKQSFLDGTHIVLDRYTMSNIIHQMSRLPKGEWQTFIDWIYDLEFKKFGLPMPDAVIYLDMPPQLAWNLVTDRYKKDESKRDIHESDYDYLLLCREAAHYAAKKLGWHIVQCVESGSSIDDKGGALMSVEDIGNAIAKAVAYLF